MDIKDLMKFNADFCMSKEEALNSSKTLAFFPDVNGNLYKRIVSPLGVCIEKVSSLPFGEDTVKLGMNFNLPKLPITLLAQIVSFFRDICADTRDEVFVRIYMNKETQEYKIVCPKQTVTSTSVNYKIEDETLETDYIAIMDIHSHDTMGAFFSGTDDKDERTPGRLYMVLGKLDTHNIEYKLRTFVDSHVEVEFFEVWERPSFSVSSDVPLNISVKDEDLIHGILEAVVEYPAEWKDQIERRTYSSISNVGYAGGYSRNSYSKTNYDGFGSSQLTLFGDTDEEESFVSRPYPKSFPSYASAMDEDDDDTPILDMENDIDAKYEAGLDAASELIDNLDNPEDFAVLEGIIAGFENAGWLDVFIKAIRKHMTDSEI